MIHNYDDRPIVRHKKEQKPLRTNSSVTVFTISEQQVEKILKELSTEKAAGVDIMSLEQKLQQIIQKITSLTISYQ